VKASLSIRRTICGRISREELKKKYPHSRRAGCDGSSHEESAKEIVGEPNVMEAPDIQCQICGFEVNVAASRAQCRADTSARPCLYGKVIL
jgi:hypothetical protein